ncbi:MAG TPA: type II CAAX endopeptidase family protein [Agromyces sp.]|nr:type II CAAX endopeptidase family protein [Agromyces sp.]
MIVQARLPSSARSAGGPARHVPALFFALTAVLSLPFLILGALVDTPEGAVVDLPLSALQVFAPFLAAILLVLRESGWRGVGRLIADALDVRRLRSARVLVPLALIMPMIYFASYGIMRLAGRQLPGFEFSVTAAVVLLVMFLLSGFFEEVGWTGYALEPLRQRLGYLGAALVIGVVWALFHVPADLQGDRDLEWIAWYRLASVMLRVVIVWAYLVTGRALAAAILVHATDNLSWSLFPVGGSHYDPLFMAPVSVAVAAVLVFTAFPAWSPPRENRASRLS